MIYLLDQLSSQIMNNEILNKIEKNDAKLCVIGLGQVGLPTALTFCNAGYDIIGYDINKNTLSKLESRQSPFEEKGLRNLLSQCIDSGRFHASDNLLDSVNLSDVIIVCVQTPIDEGIKPDLSALEKACKSLSEINLENKLIIIESSIPPGAFKDFVIPILSKKKGEKINFFIAYVPERLSPGQALLEIQITPRVIGTEDEKSGNLAKKLYEKIVKAEIFITKSKIAELSKLVENSYRDVNIAFANEISMICEKYGIDFMELLQICNSHPRVNLHKPGPGVGGPCLPKDPYLLLNPQGMPQIESAIIRESRKINDSMPHHVADLVLNALKSQNKKPSKCTILILGVAYKGNVSDTRFSPSREIISDLKKNGCNVLVNDPLSSEDFGGRVVKDIWEGITSSDVLVFVTDHDDFKKLDLTKIKKIMKQIPIIVDTRRIFDSNEVEKKGIQYCAVGYRDST